MFAPGLELPMARLRAHKIFRYTVLPLLIANQAQPFQKAALK